MGVIEEEDSLDFSSSVKSQVPSVDNRMFQESINPGLGVG
jgi:hypothetical protein